MCQYSADDGNASEWHAIHLGTLAFSGAGLLCVEATAVNPEGRITPGCLGLYSDANEAALKHVITGLRNFSSIPLAIQLSHAGRKASSRAPWEGGSLIAPTEGGWPTLAPSAIAQRPEEDPPKEMDRQDLNQVVADFVSAARRAVRLGFDVLELHMAHGYLLHQFLSPLSNQRADQYGGSMENRMRFPLEVFSAVQQAVGTKVPVGVRLSATDWVENGWDIEQSIVLCKRLESMGCAFVDVTSGGLSYLQKIAVGPGYQVPFAQRIKQTITIPVIAVGMITQPAQAEKVVGEGSADMVAIARGMLINPRWGWTAAAELGATVNVPKQFWRSLPPGHPQIFGDVRAVNR
jgi:2,4-dienoyl-CoA reductase-like NADH-dependent reductase (Old Yellow Enzyme family)